MAASLWAADRSLPDLNSNREIYKDLNVRMGQTFLSVRSCTACYGRNSGLRQGLMSDRTLNQAASRLTFTQRTAVPIGFPRLR